MDECPFFQSFTKTIESQTIHGDRQANKTDQTKAFWCSHPKHSPVDLKIIKKVVGASNFLKCQGELSRCQLSQEQYNDM